MSEQRKINFEYPEDGTTKTAAEIKADIPAGGRIRVEGSAPKVPAIYPAMGKVMAATKAIEKSQTSTGATAFKYRGIDDVMNGLHQAMAEAGVFMLTEAHYDCMLRTTKMYTSTKWGREVTKEATEVVLPVTFHFVSAEDGSEITADTIGEGIDYGDKGVTKSMSIALKYALLQAFLIPTNDMAEPDKDEYEPADIDKNGAKEKKPRQDQRSDQRQKQPKQEPATEPDQPKAPKKPRQEPPQDVKNALAYKLPDGTLGEIYKANKALFDDIAKNGSDLERDLCRIIEQYVALCRKNKEPKEAK